MFITLIEGHFALAGVHRVEATFVRHHPFLTSWNFKHARSGVGLDWSSQHRTGHTTSAGLDQSSQHPTRVAHVGLSHVLPAPYHPLRWYRTRHDPPSTT